MGNQNTEVSARDLEDRSAPLQRPGDEDHRIQYLTPPNDKIKVVAHQERPRKTACFQRSKIENPVGETGGKKKRKFQVLEFARQERGRIVRELWFRN